jgi:phosphoribosylaminoimidazole carboxylase
VPSWIKVLLTRILALLFFLNIYVFFADGSSSSAGQLSALCVEGNPNIQPNKIMELAAISDVLTPVHHCCMEPLRTLESKSFPLCPDLNTIELMQNKLLQKNRLKECGVPMAVFQPVQQVDDIARFAQRYNYPVFLKQIHHREDDATGSLKKIVVHGEDDLEDAFTAIGGGAYGEIVVEEIVEFLKELSIIVVRVKNSDDLLTYPVAEFHRRLEGDLTIVPAQISATTSDAAIDIAKSAVSVLTGQGVFCVELYVLADDSIVVNEVVAHPHRSGNFSLTACDVDQYEMHLRAILDFPCTVPTLIVPTVASMLVKSTSSVMTDVKERFQKLMKLQGVSGHWYGKLNCHVGSVMGHVHVSAKDIYSLRDKLTSLDVTSHGIPERPSMVAIILESENDYAVSDQIAKVLSKFDVTFELVMISPHKTPTKLYTFAQSSLEKGFQVIIAMGGLSGVLPSMVASLCLLPVIACLQDGQNHTISANHTPVGIPVATINSAACTNAAFFALRILGLQNASLIARLDEFAILQEEEILKASDKLVHSR